MAGLVPAIDETAERTWMRGSPPGFMVTVRRQRNPGARMTCQMYRIKS
jgi:hypothetical protein